MRIRRGHHEQNFTILPNSFLQDERMSWTTRGILAEILSRPPGWECTADSLAASATKARGERVGEGRRAVRGSFAEGEKFGYIVRTRERIAAGEPDAGQFHTVLTFYDTPQNPSQGTGTGTSASPAEAPNVPGRTDVPVMDRPSPVRLKKEQKKKEQQDQKNSAVAQAPDQSAPPEIPAIAEVTAIAEVPASAGAYHGEMTKPRNPKDSYRGDVRQRDDDWRAQLEAADPDDLYIALDQYRSAREGLEDWAYRTAASDLGIDLAVDEDVPEDPDDDWTRLAYLYLLKKHDSDPGDWDIQAVLLDALDDSIQAPPRPYRRVEKLPTPAGMTSREFADQMKAVVVRMEPAEIGPYIAEFREARPGVWWESRGDAVKRLRLRKEKATAQAVNYVALKIAIDRYVGRGTWEMELVPPPMRPQGWQSPGEAPPWAA